MIIRRARSVAAFVLFAWLSTGCGSAMHASAQRAPSVSESAGWLAWSAAEDGTARTVWLDASGTELAARDEVIIAHGPRLYRAVVEPTQVPLPTCEQLERGDTDAPVGEPASLTRVSLVELGTERRVVMIEPHPPEGEASLEQRAVLLSSLGPYVFVRTTLASFLCGAHGNVDVVLQAFDLARGARIEGMAASGEEALAERASELVIADAEQMGEPPELESLRREASVPVLAEGRVLMEHVFVIDACYACSDPEWSSYTRSVRVRDASLPAELAPYAAFPEPVRRWLAAHRDVRGVSVVPAAERERALGLFRAQ